MMKKTFSMLMLLLVVALSLPQIAKAQGMDQPLPLDENVRYGVLPNGLTYYVRHNGHPKGQADFYIAQKVGSILEEDNQRGLAHFLEHMCFNGTENFPGNSLIDWLESIGVKFGYNLNAYTSIDETVYNISNVPVDRTGVQDTCLLILHDWADGLLLDPEEIDKERGVIHQEWRSTNVGQQRILEKLLPTLYPGSKYAYRLPIGTMEVVDNFPPKDLRDYYEKWYRPDQQGVIVVGDIDVDRIEAKIKEIFSPIKMPANVAPREYFPVPDHKGTIYAVGSDPEQTHNIVMVSFLSDPLPTEQNNTIMYYLQNYVEDCIASMINQRLSDISRDPNAPFAFASVDFGEFLVSKTKDGFNITGVSKTDEIEPTLETVYREVLRAVKGGFTQAEYDRVKDEYLASIERLYNNRATTPNESYVKEYVKHFTDNIAAPGIETDYQLAQMLTQMIDVNTINQMLPELITPDNRVVLVMQPQKDGVKYPTEQTLAAVIDGVEGENLEAYVENVKSEPLIPMIPAPGKVVSESKMPEFDAVTWTLSNGVKVIVKKTDFKEDEILFTALANNGLATLPESSANSIVFLPAALQTLGLGDYTNADLEKYLMGKKASIEMDFDSYTRDVQGSATPKDLPTLMELIYSAFTAPNIDANEFDAYKSALAGVLTNQANNPNYVFGVKMKEALYSSPTQQELTLDVVNGADLATTNAILKAMTANAADYTFVFVGNVDLNTLKPLVEQYIATLPADASTATIGMPKHFASTQMKGGKGIDEYFMKMETPQTTAYVVEWGEMDYTPANRMLAAIAGQILTNRLLENVREKEGAVYSIGAQGVMYRVEPQNTRVVTAFPMTPDKKDLVLGMVESEFNNIAKSITPEELTKAKEFMLKNYKEGLKLNGDWLGYIGGYTRNGVDTFNGYEETINAITPAQVSDFMKKLAAQGNYRVVLLSPEQ